MNILLLLNVLIIFFTSRKLDQEKMNVKKKKIHADTGSNLRNGKRTFEKMIKLVSLPLLLLTKLFSEVPPTLDFDWSMVDRCSFILYTHMKINKHVLDFTVPCP